MPAAIDAPEAVLSLPEIPGAGALFPGGYGRFRIIRVQNFTPAKGGALFLGKSNQLEEGLTGVDIPAIRLTNPDAIVDLLADTPVQAFTMPQRFFSLFASGNINPNANMSLIG